jgi:hypothetical protein
MDDQWHLVHITWDNASHTSSIYVDGTLENAMTDSNVDTGSGSANSLHIGSRTDYNTLRFHIGEIDEVRISNPVKNSSWIWTEYHNQYDPESFFDVGVEESVPTGDITPPVISNVDASPDPQVSGGLVNITCDVSDDVAVNQVWVNIMDPLGGTRNETMLSGSFYFEDSYSLVGMYSYFIWANDTSNNSAMSTIHTFTILESVEYTTVSILPQVRRCLLRRRLR